MRKNSGRRLSVFLGVCAVCGILTVCAALSRTARAAESAAIFIDGAAASETMAIAPGRHSVAAQADGETVCLAVYENGRFAAVSFDGTLAYDFPDSGAEIRLFRLDSAFRPLGPAVRVKQAARRLVYSGEAICYDEFNDEAYRDFDDYAVRLKVVTKDGIMTEIRDIGGYGPSGNPTDAANTYFLEMAASQIPERILAAQSTEGVDAVSGATCASHAIVRAVEAALRTTPETESDSGGSGEEDSVPDGIYRGSAQCLTGNINYMADVDVTVRSGLITEISDRTLKTPLSTRDRELYQRAWDGLYETLAHGGQRADGFRMADAVSGATVSSAAIQSAVRDALKTRTAASGITGQIYAPEGISLYAVAYPVVTVENGTIAGIRVVPGPNTDREHLERFADTIRERQSVSGLSYPPEIADDAFAIANLTDQILYGKGVLR